MIELDVVPYEESLELKKIGFDERCFKCKVIGKEHLDYTPSDYDDFPEQKEVEVLTPLFPQAFRWFREKHDRHSYIEQYTSHNLEYIYDYIISVPEGDEEWDEERYYDSFEEAQLACLRKLIEIVKNQI